MRLAVLMTLVALGCSAERYPATARYPGTEAAPEEVGEPAFRDVEEAAAESAEPLPNQSALKRRIIYTADVDLVVEDFDPIPDQVEELAKRFDGFVASSTVTGSPGSPRTGQWNLRVPVEHYQEFLAAARQLGEVQQVSVDSQDVTEEFYDVEARIRNKKKEEARLLELLEDATGKLEDILAVERELSRVREEIERVEGRLRVLKDLTSLTTVQLSVREISDYVPEEAVSYTTRVRRGFQASLAALVSFLQAVSIAVVVLLPWLPVFLAVLIALIVLWRIADRVARRRSTGPRARAGASVTGGESPPS